MAVGYTIRTSRQRQVAYAVHGLLRASRSKPGSLRFDQRLREEVLGLEFVARAALGSKLNVSPISSTPSVGRRRWPIDASIASFGSPVS